MGFQILFVFCVAVVFNALANILMKASSIPENAGLWSVSSLPEPLRGLLNPYFLGGLAAFGLALIGYKFVLGKGLKLSLAYPVFTSSGFILVLLASAYFFKERLNWVQWMGIGFIMIGVWLTALQMFDLEN